MICINCNGKGAVFLTSDVYSTLIVCGMCRGSGIEKKDNKMHETQRTICDWADKIFGHVKNPNVSIERMLKECKELNDKYESGAATYEDMIDEMADIFITGYRAFDTLGYNAHACIDHKM